MSVPTPMKPAHITAFLHLLRHPPAAEDLQALTAGLDGEVVSNPQNTVPGFWNFIKNSPDTVVNAITNNFLAGQVPIGQGLLLRDFVAKNFQITPEKDGSIIWDGSTPKEQDSMLSKVNPEERLGLGQNI